MSQRATIAILIGVGCTFFSGLATADYYVGQCQCNDATCSSQGRAWPFEGETPADVSAQCSAKTHGHGAITSISLVKEEDAKLRCSGERPGASAKSGIWQGVNGGVKESKSTRVCVKSEPKQIATKLYCEQDDETKIYGCGWSVNTNDKRCNYMASRGMYVGKNPNGSRTYCWSLNDEGVGRLRHYRLSADFK